MIRRHEIKKRIKKLNKNGLHMKREAEMKNCNEKHRMQRILLTRALCVAHVDAV